MNTAARKRIYLSAPHIGENEQKFVREAFESNWVAPLGPNVDGFERELAKLVGVADGAALTTGTAAIHLTLKYLGVEAGDYVLCSTLTFSGTCNPIIYQGATPVFIDSDEASWNMSPQALARAIAGLKAQGIKPKAALVVDLYGQSADYARLLPILEREGIPLIEDSAEALGATCGNRHCGAFGRFGIFSFNGNKIITTSGGGMVVADDLNALKKIRFWATQSRDPARHYQHSELGFNYRMSNILAGIGRGQLQVLPQRIARRKAINQTYRAAFADIPEMEFMPIAAYGEPNFWLSVITLKPGAKIAPSQIMDALEAENIESRPIWKPMHLQPFFAGHPFYSHLEAGGSVAENLFNRGVCLPSGSSMSEDDQAKVIEIVRKLYGKVR